MTIQEIITGLGTESPAERDYLQQRLQNDVFERFVYKVVSFGRAEDIATVRSFLTTHSEADRQQLWTLINNPYYTELLADAWEEELRPLVEAQEAATP